MLKTTTSNVDDLRREGSLRAKSKHGCQVAATVRDAIRLAAALGIDRIWVDSLCIVQDDDQTRGIHLASMAAIYANAYVTFMTVEGRDARHGISGVPKGKRTCRRACCTLGFRSGERLALEMNRSRSLEEAPWSTRGWTYQEELFSTRAIILNGGTEVRCLDGCIRLSDRNRTEPINFASAVLEKCGNNTLAARAAWMDCVTFYNKRDFTYDIDVLNALAGMSKVFEHHFPKGIHHGFPVAEAIRFTSLVWRLTSPDPTSPLKWSRRRFALVPGTAINRLPSWSWVGWQGDLSYTGRMMRVQDSVFQPRAPYFAAKQFPDHTAVSSPRVWILMPTDGAIGVRQFKLQLLYC